MPGLPWLRLYAEVPDDPKVMKLSPATFRNWICVLCIASRYGGILPTMEDTAFNLHMTKAKAARAISELISAGLLDQTDLGLRPHAWDRRQFKSDSSTERSRKSRSSGDECNAPCDVPATSHATDQIQIQKQKQTVSYGTPLPPSETSPPLDVAFSDLLKAWPGTRNARFASGVWSEYVRQGVITEENIGDIMAGFGRYRESAVWEREDGRFIVSFDNWLRQKLWKDRPAPSAEAKARMRKRSNTGTDALAEYAPPWDEAS
jgi:hypothetical protein